MKSDKRIVVAGSVILDEIHLPDGESKTSFGGITYNIRYLSRFLQDYEIVPVSWIGEAEFREFIDCFSGYSNIDFSYIKTFSGPSNRNLIIYNEDKSKKEHLEVNTPPITVEDLEGLREAKLFLINYTNPFDLTLEDLKALRSMSDSCIYIDIHSLLRGWDEEGNFILKPFSGFQDWSRNADILQLNREETGAFVGLELNTLNELKEGGELILASGVRIVNITLDKEGALVIYRDGKDIKYYLQSPPRIEIKDPTGCGDVFSAGFIASYLETKDPVLSLGFAVERASLSAMRSGL